MEVARRVASEVARRAPRLTPRRLVAAAAAPRKRLPERTVVVQCAGCRFELFHYAKGNGKGSNLVKVYKERVLRDLRPDGSDETLCPGCGVELFRDALVHGRPALKCVGGKVRMK